MRDQISKVSTSSTWLVWGIKYLKDYPLEFLFPKNFFGTIGFRLGDGIRCLEPEAQNAVLSLEVAKIQFSN